MNQLPLQFLNMVELSNYCCFLEAIRLHENFAQSSNLVAYQLSTTCIRCFLMFMNHHFFVLKLILHCILLFSSADIIAAAVLSGNRNFEGRVHPLTRANYLASPPLVVAYALAGTVSIYNYLSYDLSDSYCPLDAPANHNSGWALD